MHSLRLLNNSFVTQSLSIITIWWVVKDWIRSRKRQARTGGLFRCSWA